MSTGTFDYKSVDKWGKAFLDENRDVLTPEIIHALRNSVSDIEEGPSILRWLDQKLAALSIPTDTSDLVLRLRAMFKSIFLYHGIRPTSLRPFFEHGLLSGTPERVEETARQVFGRGQFAEVSDQEIENIVAELRPHVEFQKNRVYFCLDDRNFEDCGHYLIYGSEYLSWVAARLQRQDGFGHEAYHQALRKRGVPTVLVVALPLAELPKQYQSLWKDVLVDFLWMLAEDRTSLYKLDYTVVLQYVSPNLIVDHYHPQEIRDPLFGFVIRKTPQIHCDCC